MKTSIIIIMEFAVAHHFDFVRINDTTIFYKSS